MKFRKRLDVNTAHVQHLSDNLLHVTIRRPLVSWKAFDSFYFSGYSHFRKNVSIVKARALLKNNRRFPKVF